MLSVPTTLKLINNKLSYLQEHIEFNNTLVNYFTEENANKVIITVLIGNKELSYWTSLYNVVKDSSYTGRFVIKGLFDKLLKSDIAFCLNVRCEVKLLTVIYMDNFEFSMHENKGEK